MNFTKSFIAGICIVSSISPITFVRAAGEEARLFFSPSTLSTSVGEVFQVDILVDSNDMSFDTVRANIDYPEHLVSLNSVSYSPVFPLQLPLNTIDNATGQASIGVYTSTPQSGDSARVATVSFTAMGCGDGEIFFRTSSHIIENGDDVGNITDSGTFPLYIQGVGASCAPEIVEEVSPNLPSADLSLEQQALLYFTNFVPRLPASAEDWAVIHCIAYGTCRESDNIERESAARLRFVEKFGVETSTAIHENFIESMGDYPEIYGDIGEVITAPSYEPELPSAVERNYNISSCTFFTPITRGAVESDSVRCLQMFLANQGEAIYADGRVTGNYLDLTTEAVRLFQISQGITDTDGTIVGEVTLAAIRTFLGR